MATTKDDAGSNVEVLVSCIAATDSAASCGSFVPKEKVNECSHKLSSKSLIPYMHDKVAGFQEARFIGRTKAIPRFCSCRPERHKGSVQQTSFGIFIQ